jgi:hypothetical protein
MPRANKGRTSGIHGKMHPYLRPERWISGELCFWRERPEMYTVNAHTYFELMVESLKNEVKNIATIQPNLHER